jgi:predicted DCC family thiol-disulfide oxidoreductase YuxK
LANSRRNIVVFDGACGVCTALKDWVARQDRADRLAFVPFQAADLGELAPGLTPQMAGQALHFLGRDGERHRGARAAFETLRRLPGIWGAIGAIGAWPPLSLLAEPFYRLFARYRGVISQKLGLDRCALPVGEEKITPSD